tara:strand:- start:145 stop:1254 length:1110 start_codon:yes stop_codon:yes gene_type:complete
MIIKVESTINKTDYPELEIISNPIDEPIIIKDEWEAQGYYPLHGRESDRLLQVIHDLAHPDNDVTFSNHDSLLQQNYDRWCEEVGMVAPAIKVNPNPRFMISTYVNTMNNLWHDYQAPKHERLYKLVTLVNNPRIFRLLTLGRLAGNAFFKYSYRVAPTHLLGDKESIEESWETTTKVWDRSPKGFWRWYREDKIRGGNCIIIPKHSTIYPADYPAPFDLSFREFNAKERVSLTEECPEGAIGTSCQHDIFPPVEWWQSYIDLVQENKVCVANYLSDKSCKPLYWKKIFLTIGGPGWYKHFQEMGFKLYDELFDYSFDSNPLFEERWKHIMKQCDKILEMDRDDIKQIEKRLQPKMEYNAKRIRELAVH